MDTCPDTSCLQMRQAPRRPCHAPLERVLICTAVPHAVLPPLRPLLLVGGL